MRIIQYIRLYNVRRIMMSIASTHSMLIVCCGDVTKFFLSTLTIDDGFATYSYDAAYKNRISWSIIICNTLKVYN